MSLQTVRYRTQWATQFYAAAELTRRGYLVSLTFGNASTVDLLVESPTGVLFTVDVKGQSGRGFWLVQCRPANPNHYFMLVYLPSGLHVGPKFFILSSDELMQLRAEYKTAMRKRGRYRDDLGGINWGTAANYADKWKNLPQ